MAEDLARRKFGNDICAICFQVHPSGFACDGWMRGHTPLFGDSRKLVTLDQDGMTWVGIRAWTGAEWVNNNQRETARVVAWRDLPEPAKQ